MTPSFRSCSRDGHIPSRSRWRTEKLVLRAAFTFPGRAGDLALPDRSFMDGETISLIPLLSDVYLDALLGLV